MNHSHLVGLELDPGVPERRELIVLVGEDQPRRGQPQVGRPRAVQLAGAQPLDRIGDRRRTHAVLHHHRRLPARQADLVEHDSVVQADAADHADRVRRQHLDVLALRELQALDHLRGPDEHLLAAAVQPHDDATSARLDAYDHPEGLAAGLVPPDQVLGYELIGHDNRVVAGRCTLTATRSARKPCGWVARNW